MKNKVVCVVHGEHSRTGRVGRTLKTLGFEEARCCHKLGDPLPESFDDVAGAVVFGGPMSANDDREHEFIANELRWIETVLEARVPFLGICLGGQMLARVLGAEVKPHEDDWYEIGFHPVRPTECGRDWMRDLEHVYQWHGEGFDLPAGSELLATTENGRFPNQAFRYGDRTFGLQFHPECTREVIEWWMSGDANEKLTYKGAQQPQDQLVSADKHRACIDAWTLHFLADWLHTGDEEDAEPVTQARAAAS